MTTATAPTPVDATAYVGVDLSSTWLDVAQAARPRPRRVRRHEVGVASLVEGSVAQPPALIALEAADGPETALASAAAAAGLAVAVVNPRRVREFVCASGTLAKTDRVDAEVLAHFGARMRPAVPPCPVRRPKRRRRWSAGGGGSSRCSRWSAIAARAWMNASLRVWTSMSPGSRQR